MCKIWASGELNLKYIMHGSLWSFNIPPRQPPGHMNFWKLAHSNSILMGQNGVQMPYLSAGFDGTLKCKLKIINENRDCGFSSKNYNWTVQQCKLLRKIFQPVLWTPQESKSLFICRFTFEQVLTELDSLCDQWMCTISQSHVLVFGAAFGLPFFTCKHHNTV